MRPSLTGWGTLTQRGTAPCNTRSWLTTPNLWARSRRQTTSSKPLHADHGDPRSRNRLLFSWHRLEEPNYGNSTRIQRNNLAAVKIHPRCSRPKRRAPLRWLQLAVARLPGWRPTSSTTCQLEHEGTRTLLAPFKKEDRPTSL